MNQAEIIARLERAHRKAAYELRDCLEEFKEEEPDFPSLRSMQDDFSYLSKKMTLKTLLSKIESVSTIKDLMK